MVIHAWSARSGVNAATPAWYARTMFRWSLFKSSTAQRMLACLSSASMRCGGCGAKVGADVLSRAMGRLKPEIVARPELVVGLDSPDDCAVVRGGDGPDAELTVHTVDFFRYFMGVCTDPYVFGRCVSDYFTTTNNNDNNHTAYYYY